VPKNELFNEELMMQLDALVDIIDKNRDLFIESRLKHKKNMPGMEAKRTALEEAELLSRSLQQNIHELCRLGAPDVVRMDKITAGLGGVAAGKQATAEERMAAFLVRLSHSVLRQEVGA